jgi:hypothetical protein
MENYKMSLIDPVTNGLKDFNDLDDSILFLPISDNEIKSDKKK